MEFPKALVQLNNFPNYLKTKIWEFIFILSSNVWILWMIKILCIACDHGKTYVFIWKETGLKLHQGCPSTIWSYLKVTAFYCFLKPQSLTGSSYDINLLLGPKINTHVHAGEKCNYVEKYMSIITVVLEFLFFMLWWI